MSGKRQIMSIDSEPRGLPTYVKIGNKYQLIGKTPFFYETVVAPSHMIYMQTDRKGTAKKIRINCDWRWQEALLPDLGILGIGIAVGTGQWIWGTVFLGNDYLRDTVYDCEQYVQVVLQEAKPDRMECHKFIVLPPKHDNPLVAEKIVKEWHLAIKKELKDCDDIIFNGDSLDNLAKFNVDNVKQAPINKFTPKQLRKIGLDSKATHIVQIALETHTDSIHAHGRAFDLHKNSFDPKYTKDFTVLDQHGLNKTFLETLSHYFNLFPNAITVGASSNQLETEESINVIRKKEHNLVPRYLSGVSINSIEHPLGYAPWDYSAAIYPSLIAFYQNWEYDVAVPCDSVSPDCGSGTERHTFSYFYGLPLINAGSTLHTPGGAFSLAVNAGPLIATVRENNRRFTKGLGATAGISLGWYGFMSERYYLFINLNYNAIPEKFALQDHLLKDYDKKTLNKALFGVGYFTPELRRNLSRLFHRWL